MPTLKSGAAQRVDLRSSRSGVSWKGKGCFSLQGNLNTVAGSTRAICTPPQSQLSTKKTCIIQVGSNSFDHHFHCVVEAVREPHCRVCGSEGHGEAVSTPVHSAGFKERARRPPVLLDQHCPCGEKEQMTPRYCRENRAGNASGSPRDRRSMWVLLWGVCAPAARSVSYPLCRLSGKTGHCPTWRGLGQPAFGGDAGLAGEEGC